MVDIVETEEGDAMSVPTTNSSSYVTEVRDVSGFSGIALCGIGRVRLQQTGQESLEVRAPKRWMNRIETRVKNGTLILGFKKRAFPVFSTSLRRRDEIEFLITADVIKELSISGAGNFEMDRLHADELRIDISGAGGVLCRELDAARVRMHISGSGKLASDKFHVDETHISSSGAAKVSLQNVAAKSFHTELSGSGRVEASGTAQEVELRISGAGSLWFEELKATRCKARISGTGKIRIHATESLETSVSGVGSVYYKGDPQLSGRTSGSGRIHRIDEN